MTWALSTPRLSELLAWTGRIALFGTFALGLFGFYTYRGFPYAPWTLLDEALTTDVQDQEIVLHSNKITALPSHYYAKLIIETGQPPNGDSKSMLEHRYLADPPGSGSDTLARATQQILGLFAEPEISAAVGDAAGVWFIVFPREELEYLANGFQAHPSLAWLSEHYSLDSVSTYGQLEAYHFVR